jgi:hypothetical protein
MTSVQRLASLPAAIVTLGVAASLWVQLTWGFESLGFAIVLLMWEISPFALVATLRAKGLMSRWGAAATGVLLAAATVVTAWGLSDDTSSTASVALLFLPFWFLAAGVLAWGFDYAARRGLRAMTGRW